jgi:hypothetical protein
VLAANAEQQGLRPLSPLEKNVSNGIVSSVTRAGAYEPFELQVSRNQILGHSTANIFAYGTTPATAGLFRTVWENMATADYVFPTSASTMTLVSTVNTDTATITIVGTDASYNLISENLVLNGTTGVTTVNSYFRINNISVSAGSVTNPSGVITLAVSTTIYAQINTQTVSGATVSIGSSQMGIYTVPNGYTFYGYRYGAYSSFNGNSANYTTYRALTNASSGVQRVIVQTPFNTTYEVQRNFPFSYLAGTDLRFQVASSAATAAVVSINIGGVLIQNNTNVTGVGT